MRLEAPLRAVDLGRRAVDRAELTSAREMEAVMRAPLMLGLLLASVASPALAQSCDQLWYERNAIYKDAGYCFKTTRGIRAFGNAGCQFDNERDVPLSANAAGRVEQIRRMERAYGCR